MKTLVKRTPSTFRGIPALLDEIFNENPIASSATSFPNRLMKPLANIKENDEAYQIEFALPGWSKKDIKIELDNGILNVSGEFTEEKSEEKFTRREFRKNSFKRSFDLNDQVEIDSIKAESKNGILSILLPKKEEVKPQAPKAIVIK